MKVVMVLGAPGSGYESVFAILAKAGVTPAKASLRFDHEAAALSEFLLQAMDVNSDTQYPTEQLQPGKVWQEFAADLVMANYRQSLWGWADHRLAWLMDFWLALEPRVKFLLAYSSPAEFLATRLKGQSKVDQLRVDSLLQHWFAWNTALLRYSLRNPERTLLVHAGSAGRKPAELLDLVRQSWGFVGLGKSPHPVELNRQQALLASIARDLIGGTHAVWGLAHQLDAVAGIPTEDVVPDRHGAWAVACELLSDHDALVGEVEAKALNAQKLADAREIEINQLIEAAAAAAQPRVPERVNAAERTLDEIGEVNAVELREENQLLLLQLHQVQEELERYFIRNRELEQQPTILFPRFVQKFWATHQPDTLAIDLRKRVEGTGWQGVEADGQWTGPGIISTLDLPPLQPGPYTVELDVVDVMAVDILSAIELEIAGQSFSTVVEWLGDNGGLPAVCSGAVGMGDQLSTEGPLQLKIKVPRVIPASTRGGRTDTRELGVRIQQVRLIRQIS